jgi:hypothetical protein
MGFIYTFAINGQSSLTDTRPALPPLVRKIEGLLYEYFVVTAESKFFIPAF